MIGFLAAVPIFQIHPFDLYKELENLNNVPLQKYFQVIQSLGLFIGPAFLLAKIFSGNSAEYLKLEKSSQTTNYVLVTLIILFAIPVINFVAQLNSQIQLPSSMSELQQAMEKSSQAYESASRAFLSVSSVPGLLLNVFIIALLPALGEELLFRGVVQRIFCNMFSNIHVGIITSSFLFSLLHMEFYGFFARWGLGILFGCMLVWSGSIWLPILAHFINNALAVILYYFINIGLIDKKIETFGATSDILPYTIFSGLVMTWGLYQLYKRNKITSPQ